MLEVEVKKEPPNMALSRAMAKMMSCEIDEATNFPLRYLKPKELKQQTLPGVRDRHAATQAQKELFRQSVARLVLANPAIRWNFVANSYEFARFVDDCMSYGFSLFTSEQRKALEDPLGVYERPAALACANTLSSERYVESVIRTVKTNLQKLFQSASEGGLKNVTVCVDGWQDVARKYMLLFSVVTHDIYGDKHFFTKHAQRSTDYALYYGFVSGWSLIARHLRNEG